MRKEQNVQSVSVLHYFSEKTMTVLGLFHNPPSFPLTDAYQNNIYNEQDM